MSATATHISDENRASAGAFVDAHAPFVATVVELRRGASTLASGVTMGWTFAMIAVGLATLAACVLLPLREANRRLAYELAGLRAEADFVDRQAQANAAFIERVHEDPALAERLVMRATRRAPAGTRFLNDAAPAATFGSSPYALTRLAPPPPQAAYASDLPLPLAGLMDDVRGRAVLMGAGLFLLGAAIVLGRNAERRVPNAE